MTYVLPKLPYEIVSLEPHLDAVTVRLHYEKHHQGYVDKLNIALSQYPEWYSCSLEEILIAWEQLPVAIQQTVRNQGGGHWAHTFYWNCMSPVASEPSTDLMQKIVQTFGSVEGLREAFIRESVSFFGSGWTWLVLDQLHNLRIYSTNNHDLPQRSGFTPLLVVDLWEHAYYLKFQNRRIEFLTAWWNVINWNFVADQYSQTAV
jgi:Fe-Mn family superoxide dismutase